MSFCSSEAVSRYTLWRHHRQKPQPSPHTAPNDKRAGRLREGEGFEGSTAKREEGRESREEAGRGINTVRRRGEERVDRERKHTQQEESTHTHLHITATCEGNT